MLKDFSGDILVLQNDSHKRLRAYKGLILKKFDRIMVAQNSFVIVDFVSGHELKFNENSEVNLRFWDNDKETLPVFVSLRHGSYQELKAGDKNELIVETDQKYKNQFLKIPNLTEKLPQNANELEDQETSEAVTPQDPTKSMLEGASLKLTNKEISTNIKSYLNQLQKCQLNALGSNLLAKGQITIAFTISPIGNTENIKILTSNTKSDQLDACVMSVFERMKFTKFDGDPIQVNYPLQFE
ncbi:MAG: AgmX/PglI C-terminal domain-containing protein [Bdellovibrionales bacterium]|nr:AgmX/PglI C-terminal domain-containing protein [Bdellovibrionales bacterium]